MTSAGGDGRVPDPDRPAATVGERLKEARRKAGMTQEAVAQRLGVTRRAVYGWEADRRTAYSFIRELASLYRTPVSMLLYGVESSSEEMAALRDQVEVIAGRLDDVQEGLGALASLTERVLDLLEARGADDVPPEVGALRD